jgi:hypothetical protein
MKTLLVPIAAACTWAQPYAGVLGGVSTLSADARAVVAPDRAASSSYKPENGLTADAFAGLNCNDYLSVQADYIWGRNALTLDGNSGAAFYERAFESRQQSVLGNVLLFFRPRSYWVRPFLSVGAGFVHLSASPDSASIVSGLAPPAAFSATKAALHVVAGIDLKIKTGWGFRYSFAETLSVNPISQALTPPASRRLANFRNLFGFVKYF